MDETLQLKGMSKELSALLTAVDHRMPIKKNTFLFQQGEEISDLYVILSGRIQIGKISLDGRELTLRICTKGDIVGELAHTNDDVKYILNAKVIENGEVGVIKKQTLDEKLLTDPALTLEFLKLMNLSYRKDQTRFRDLVLHGKKGALYSTLIRLTNSYGIKTDNSILIDIHLTNQELANFCGTSRESVNRLLNELRRDDILKIEKGKITVFDLDYLKEEINCENCPLVLCTID
ncbi:anaerobic regulatory protein [Paraliobacillus ryukyuensis]|uniref:Crp/Fnr family transcriptional regulator n=1 Tax=Paraliobacillus ryukyuensis TaxID=200904 RepID=A0A366E7C2_9BACI|nr:Crp/Fnr family transcriptional regulator [Paraliobacillus ryukyuensis]RBO98207.1 Crp/Fnr family transcriptional regulator [Paraliobacillus ryukyuensis]